MLDDDDGERRRGTRADPLERVSSRAPEGDDVAKAARGPFGYTAGKSLIADKLAKLFPAHETYVEPFCGSAAVFFVKDAAPVEVLADTNKDVVFAHRAMKSLSPSELEALAKMNWTSTPSSFRKVLKSTPTGRLDRLYKFLYLARFSFGKRRASYNHDSNGTTAQTIKKVAKFLPRYKNTTILCADYERVIAKYDGKDAFHFLDPPYIGVNSGGDGGRSIGEPDFDEARFRKVLDGIKGRFLCTYGVKGQLDTTGFEVKRMRQSRSIGRTKTIGGASTLTHLLVSNFKVAKKSLGEGVELADVMQIVDVDPGGERIMVTGSRTSVSVPEALEPARAWKNEATLLAYPAEPGPVAGEARLRFLEKRWELDLVFKVNDSAIGWSFAAQRPSSVATPERVAKSFCVEGSRFFWPMTQGVLARETPYEAVADVVTKIDRPLVELGLQSLGRHEYFLSKGSELAGQLVLEERDSSLGEKYPWLATFVSSTFVPKAMAKGAPLPPEGVSALPASLEKVVPPAYRYWEKRGDEAAVAHGALVASGFFGAGAVAMVDGEVQRVVRKFELYEPAGAPVESPAEWRVAKVAELVPEGSRLVEVGWHATLAVRPESIAKAGAESVLYVDAGAAGGGATVLELLGKTLKTHPGDYVVTVEDSPGARACLAPMGRVFQFRPGEDVGVDATKRLFVASFGVRSDDVVWLDKEIDDDAADWLARSKKPLDKVEVEEPSPRTFKVVKADDEHFVLGIVLEPDEVDAQKDVYSAAEVRSAAHKYMADYQHRGHMHKELVNEKVDILESYLAPADFTVGSQTVKKGTWLMAMRINDAKLWKLVKEDGLTGFSIGGSASRQVDPQATSKYNARKKQAAKKIAFQGIPIVIDRPRGFVQQGVDGEGVPWERTYQTDYGYIPRTKGGDGSGLDVFVGPDEKSPNAYWVVQRKDDGTFDEYKIFLGYDSAADARKVYEQHVPSKFFSSLNEGTVSQIKALLNMEPEESIEKALRKLDESRFAGNFEDDFELEDEKKKP